MAKYKIIIRKSKLWKLWNVIFPGADMAHTFIAFGRSIYCPYDPPIDIVKHEIVHLEQQKYSYLYALVWWWKYYWSLSFRYSQELAAYAHQATVIKKLNRITNSKKAIDNWMPKVYLSIAKLMASPMYGGMVTEQQALVDLTRRNG